MEFDLIQYIKSQTSIDSSVVLGIDDDAAVVNVTENHHLVVSTDTLVYGKHFNDTATAEQIGHKSLAVSLSDLAAMAATPRWATLNLTLPEIDMPWMEGFVRGFLKLANKYQVNLIGGDTTQGPLSITVTVFGEVKKDNYLSRSKAQRGDLIAVTGEIGSAAYALYNPYSKLADCLHTPEPQLYISQQIKSFAHACIDISDGLLADLGHICKQSGVGAKLSLEQIPVNPIVKNNNPEWINQALSGGDDYQLCFTFSAEDLDKLPANCSVIGQTGCGSTVRIFKNNQEIEVGNKGFVHFNNLSH